MALLELKSVRKSFGATAALAGVDLAVDAGAVRHRVAALEDTR